MLHNYPYLPFYERLHLDISGIIPYQDKYDEINQSSIHGNQQINQLRITNNNNSNNNKKSFH